MNLAINDNQPGDPEKGAAAIITLAETENPPMYLFLDQDTYDLAYQKMDQVKTDPESWKNREPEQDSKIQ